MSNTSGRGYLADAVGQSPRIDLSSPYDPSWISGKTIIITGGASGFGEGFFRKWAHYGANVIIGDINDTKGENLVKEVRQATGGSHHFVHCDVTDWQSQVDLFRIATELSPTHGIDAVVANAGITEHNQTFQKPQDLDAETPPKPDLKCFEVNLLGVLYTTHLALFYLPRNPKSQKASPSSDPAVPVADRHLLLIGSIASMYPLSMQVLYGVSKHGVMGLFRNLRATAFLNGIRVNMICPYFIDTPLLSVGARTLMAGGAMGKAEDVVEAGTRLMADRSIVGRALFVGPKVKVSNEDEWQLVPNTSKDGKEVSIREIYADDFEECEMFTAKIVRHLNKVEAYRGWIGWIYDMAGVFVYAIRSRLGR